MALNLKTRVWYNGNCEWERSGPRVWRVDSRGTDRLTEIWMGRTDKLEQFLSRWARWAKHPDFPGMYLEMMPCDDDPVITTVTLEYVGFRRGLTADALPAPTPRPRQTVQSVTCSATIGDATTTVEASFFAQTQDWSWYTVTNPALTLPLGGITSTAQPTDHLLGWRITDENGHPTSAGLAAVTAALNTLSVTELLVESGSEEIVPGKLWYCYSTTVRTLQ